MPTRAFALSPALLESDFIALVVVQDRRIVWANAAMHRLFGYAPGELVGMPTRQLYVDQETYDEFGRKLNDAIERGVAYFGQMPQRRKDGSTGWYEFNVSREAGHPHRLVGAIVDRSRSHALSLQLQESEQRYRSVLDDQTDVISRIRPDGTFVYVNEAYCRMFGKSASELVGQRWQPVAHPDDVAMVEAKLRELSADQPIASIENRVYVAGGALRWMQFVNRGIFDADGRLGEIQSVGRDITRLKQVELALRKSEAALKSAQTVARLGSFATAGDTERFTHTEETARLFDLGNPHESTFADWFSRVHPDDQAAVEAAWRAALRGAPYEMS